MSLTAMNDLNSDLAYLRFTSWSHGPLSENPENRLGAVDLIKEPQD